MYKALPWGIRNKVKKAYKLWRSDTTYPSLYFKPVKGKPGMWSARVDLDYRAVCWQEPDGWLWFWVGKHKDFDKLV